MDVTISFKQHRVQRSTIDRRSATENTRTLVVDTIDGFEKLFHQKVAKRYRVNSIIELACKHACVQSDPNPKSLLHASVRWNIKGVGEVQISALSHLRASAFASMLPLLVSER